MSEKTLVDQLRSADIKGRFGLGFGQIASCIETRYTPNSEITAKYMPYPLDADGVPCKVGDLMETDEHIPRKVVGYYLACPEYPCVTLEFVSPSVESYKLHHVEQPKTLKKEDIDALAKKSGGDFWECKNMLCENCPSKIDGKKPKEYYGTAQCYDAKALHILRLERERVAGEQAVKAWNTRAERTCKMKKARWDDGQCTWGVICSACGEKHEHEFEYSFNFCPTCGAKVVDDE